MYYCSGGVNTIGKIICKIVLDIRKRLIHSRTMNLLKTTMKLARETKLPISTICADIGVTTRWYYKLMHDQIPEPGVNKIQRLHDYLMYNRPRGSRK